MRYYYGMQSAYLAGARQHPQLEILRVAPDAHDWQPETLGDCWFFEAAEIVDPPVYILPCGEDGVPLWDWHTSRSITESKTYSWSDIVIKVNGEPLEASEIVEINYDLGGES